MPNMKSIVNGHNRSILTERSDVARTCNCPQGTTCPMNGNCLSENSIYMGTITSTLQDYTPKKYIGLSAPPWKQRFRNHKQSFVKREYAKCEIAKEIWRIKDLGGDFSVKWETLGHAPAYNPVSKRCRLCTAEKLFIAENPDPHVINKRDELVSKCRHRRKFALDLVQ